MARRGKTMRRKHRGGELEQESINSLKQSFEGNPNYEPKNDFNFLRFLLTVRLDPDTTDDAIKNASLDDLVYAAKSVTFGSSSLEPASPPEGGRKTRRRRNKKY